jgi:primary-amine oxidase
VCSQSTLTASSLHSRCDMDILGTANTLVKHSVVPATVQYDWSPTPRNTMKIERSTVISEDEGKLVSRALVRAFSRCR